METYLPPIDSKVTDLKKIYKYLKYLQGLAADANVLLVNTTLDTGAAINTYKVIWNYPCSTAPWGFSFHKRKI